MNTLYYNNYELKIYLEQGKTQHHCVCKLYSIYASSALVNHIVGLAFVNNWVPTFAVCTANVALFIS